MAEDLQIHPSKKLEELPNEIILKILQNLDMKDLIRCGTVSKRMRSISLDESLWEKINLHGKIVPIEFLQKVLNSGCKYLSLFHSRIRGDVLHLENYICCSLPIKTFYL